jgi:hypothetical protein
VKKKKFSKTKASKVSNVSNSGQCLLSPLVRFEFAHRPVFDPEASFDIPPLAGDEVQTRRELVEG